MSNSTVQILFICTGNAGRSQMAQAFFASMIGDGANVLSAGVEPWDDLHPQARRIMEGRGVDTSKHHPKHVRTFIDTPLDWVVTIGDRARDETPRLPGNPRRLHWEIADPADADGSGREAEVFQQTLVMIEARFADLLESVRTAARSSSLHRLPGISTCVVRPHIFDPATHLPAFAAAGFKCIELCCYLGSGDFPWDRPQQVIELARLARDMGLQVYSVHAEGGIGAYRGQRSERLAVDMYKIYADLAAELGALVVPIHAGVPATADKAQGLRQLRASIDELSRHVLAMPCKFGWENEPIGLSTTEHLTWIGDLGPGTFGFVLDNGHAHIAATTDAYLSGCKQLLCGLHLNDNDSTKDDHRMPGRGTFDWHDFTARLNSTQYVGPMMLEIEARDRQDDLPNLLAEAYAAVDAIT